MSQALVNQSDSPEDQDLEFTRGIRKQLVENMTKGGLPTDFKDRSLLLTALNDMDRSALGIKKIKSDEGLGNKAAAAASMLATLLNDPRIKSVGIASGDNVRRDLPMLPVDLVEPEIQEGELDNRPSSESYSTFSDRMGIS